MVAHLALVACGWDLVLVTEDFGAVSLDLLLHDEGPPGPATALEIGIGLANCLAGLHAQGVVHNRINPSNVLWNSDRQQLKLLDLKECSLLARVAAGTDDASWLGTDLVYAAPEQTGRVNSPVDARSDLYSSGVVLFELLAGRPPFALTDTRKLLHAHLARRPPNLDTLAPSAPRMLSLIVAKLLAKNPEERYASARGLARDLERCLAALREGDNPVFALATTSGPRVIDNQTFFARLGQRLVYWLTTPTLAGVLYETDLRLRPDGSSGMLVSSLERFHQYQAERAWVWNTRRWFVRAPWSAVRAYAANLNPSGTKY